MTGQLISRGPFDGPNGPVWMLFGIVSAGEQELKNGTQYTIGLPPVLVNPIDREKELAGNSVNGILRSPIWRV